MSATPEALNDLVQACGLAHCTDKQIRALVLEATGHTQEQIAEELEIEQPAVSRLLERAHKRIEEAADSVHGGDVARLMAGWVFDDDTCLFGHRMTIASNMPHASHPKRRRPRRGKGIDKDSEPVVDSRM